MATAAEVVKIKTQSLMSRLILIAALLITGCQTLPYHSYDYSQDQAYRILPLPNEYDLEKTQQLISAALTSWNSHLTPVIQDNPVRYTIYQWDLTYYDKVTITIEPMATDRLRLVFERAGSVRHEGLPAIEALYERIQTQCCRLNL